MSVHYGILNVLKITTYKAPLTNRHYWWVNVADVEEEGLAGDVGFDIEFIFGLDLVVHVDWLY